MAGIMTLLLYAVIVGVLGKFCLCNTYIFINNANISM